VLFLQAFEQVERVRQRLRTRPRRLQAFPYHTFDQKVTRQSQNRLSQAFALLEPVRQQLRTRPEALALPTPPHLSGALRVTSFSGAASYLDGNMTYQAAFASLRNQPQSRGTPGQE